MMLIMRIYCCSFVFLVITVLTAASREKRETVSLDAGNWDSCKPNASAPSTRVNTWDRLAVLRSHFSTAGIQAYLVPAEDEHQSEYPSQYDKRRGYISGFQGSAGFAVVTINKAALWTDGRYFLEAEATLDCYWTLMRMREPGVPTMIEWLKKELRSGERLGANPLLIGSSDWKTYKEDLAKSGIGIVQMNDLIDYFWSTNNGRPHQPDTPINALPLQFAGRSWQDKVSDMRAAMAEKEVDMMVVTGLDETAWLFNLRASDIEYNPFFLSYAIIDNTSTTLYLLNHTRKLAANPTDEETRTTVAVHLNTNNDGTCSGRSGECVLVKEYVSSNVINDVRNRSLSSGSRKVWLGFTCNYAVYYAVMDENKIYQANTPIATTKTKKNPIEVEGMKKSHVRDATALITFLAKLEKEVKAGKKWTELSASNDLDAHRREQQYNRGLSFTTISGSGSNGAIIHYAVSNLTSKDITTRDMYLLDSGGQYLDGTTDVTRTLHFGTPTDYEKECYTRVLMGHINLFLAKWPKGLYGREIDAFARAPLWDVGLVYRHGTGHGIGMFLSVHEGPVYISKSTEGDLTRRQVLDEYMFLSDEPGYYEDGKFGIRLENIVMVKNATTKYKFPDTQFLMFEHITFVPYEPNLINVDMLSDTQIQYLNDYNKLVRDQVGPELKRQGKTEGYEWMIRKSEPILETTTSGADRLMIAQLGGLLLLVLFLLF